MAVLRVSLLGTSHPLVCVCWGGRGLGSSQPGTVCPLPVCPRTGLEHSLRSLWSPVWMLPEQAGGRGTRGGLSGLAPILQLTWCPSVGHER